MSDSRVLKHVGMIGQCMPSLEAARRENAQQISYRQIDRQKWLLEMRRNMKVEFEKPYIPMS
jgi:hypothetical protein